MKLNLKPKYSCEICGEELYSLSAYNVHIRWHDKMEIEQIEIDNRLELLLNVPKEELWK